MVKYEPGDLVENVRIGMVGHVIRRCYRFNSRKKVLSVYVKLLDGKKTYWRMNSCRKKENYRA